MNLPVVVDVAIGLFFVYLLYGLLVSILQELLATYFGFRSKVLEQGIARMLEDELGKTTLCKRVKTLFTKSPTDGESQAVVSSFYEHPLIKYLSQGGVGKQASYFKGETFSKVVIDLLSGQTHTPDTDLKALIDKALKDKTFLRNSINIPEETYIQLNTLWLNAQSDVSKFKTELEGWFDEMMERVTGWYKKYTQLVVMGISFVLAVAFNVDTLKIVENLQDNGEWRNQVVAMSENFVKSHPDLQSEYFLSIQNNEVKAGLTTDDSMWTKEQLDSASLQRYDSLCRVKDRYQKLADSLVRNDIQKMNTAMGLGLGSLKCWPCGDKRPTSADSDKGSTSCRCDKMNLFEKICVFLWCLFKSMVGWVITTLAISLGAPFWFDVLNKFMKLRNSVASTSKQEGKTS